MPDKSVTGNAEINKLLDYYDYDIVDLEYGSVDKYISPRILNILRIARRSEMQKVIPLMLLQSAKEEEELDPNVN